MGLVQLGVSQSCDLGQATTVDYVVCSTLLFLGDEI
jgi:hypothetical protein